MITGVHALVFTSEPQEARAFFRDVLRWPWVDAGDGWLIFALPPAELGVHPSDGSASHEVYLMCDDIEATVAELQGRGVRFTTPVRDQGFGSVTRFAIPGGELGLYERKHRTPLSPESPSSEDETKKHTRQS